MKRVWRHIRRGFIILCSLAVLVAAVYVFITSVKILLWPAVLALLLMSLESLAIGLYGFSWRPKRCGWLWKVVAIAAVFSHTPDWLYAGGLPDASEAFDRAALLTLLVAGGLRFCQFYFMLRFGFSPKLPPERFSGRIAIFALLGAALIAFQQRVPIFAPHIRVEHNYVWELNQLTHPEDYDYRENAAVDYERIMSHIPPMPAEVNSVRDIWPGDMSDLQRQAAEDWVSSDRQVVAEFRVASRKPYYWVRRYAPDGYLMDAQIPELRDLRQAAYLVLLQAKLQAYHGQTESALDSVTATYATGTQLAGPRSVIEQLVGLGIRKMALDTGFSIVSQADVDATLLSRFQQDITDLYSRLDRDFDFAAERLMVLDWIQRVFSDDGDGNGCISRRRSLRQGWGWIRIDRAETTRTLDGLLSSLALSARTTPWRCREQGLPGPESWQNESNMALVSFLPGWTESVSIAWRLRTKTNALIATLAVLRFEAEEARWPESLEELVAMGYLDHVPEDPFGGQALTYRHQEDDFVLYSFGLDFDDDGGARSDWGRGDSGGDQFFWPISAQTTSPSSSEDDPHQP